MNVKKFFSYLFAACLGYLVVLTLINIILIPLVSAYIFLLKPSSFAILSPQLDAILTLFIVLVGIYAGIKSYRNKNNFFIIFWPNKNKILLSFILSVLIILTVLLLYGLEGFSTYDLSTYELKIVSSALFIPLAIIYFAIKSYPFSSLVEFIYKPGGDEVFRKKRIAAIVLLILLNPVS